MQNLYKIIFLFIIGFSAQAQELLSLEDAVKIALENNYDIKIAENNSKIDATNNNLANAGMLPSLNANFTNNNSQLDTKQTQGDGTVRELDGAKNMNLTYGVGLDWTIFDGLSMFARKEQLNVLEQQGKAELQTAILTRISDVYTTYFDLVQQQQVLASIDTAIVISNQRLTTAQNRFSIGKASKLEVLNAQVDLNSDLSLQLRQKELIKISKIRLNELLVRDIQTDFKVTNEVTFEQNLDFNELKSTAEKQNPQLQAQILSKKVADLNLKQVKGNRYPTVRVTSGYNFTRSEASLGFITQSSGQGFVYGVTATVPIFNGFLQNKNEKVAKYQVENAGFLLEQQKLSLSSQLSSLYASYQTNLELVKVEEKNVEIAKQNLDITLAKFKIGTITTIEFRTAQQNFVEAAVRYSNAQYVTKLSEINLKELAGTLKLN
ncbi:TolC family protein [Flavobacterium lacisediminis]|uniref:TolC family protein n=1 Tax=Flavobacterium lacisediminis TaxID=2989705 RepID=A0ABT3EIR1_9FLAO|nr:TolC family protein [Flavobacterium lacisediminis]MCW1148452.1 TolC family protein [Flavobacterium lacisediminis]